MSDQTTQTTQTLLELAFQHAAASATAKTGRQVTLDQAAAPDAQALLRFDVQFAGGALLSWYVSNADATGFADLLIGGAGDRTATLTEMHLDALSGAFSEMLERAVDGINTGLSTPLAPGGVDMGMESALPLADPAAITLTRSFSIDGFGAMPVHAVANPALVGLLAPLARTDLSGAAAGAPAAEPTGAAAPGPFSAPQTVGDTNVVQLQSLTDRDNTPRPQGDLRMLLNVPLNVTVELGRVERTVRDLLQLGVGSVIELSKLAGDPMDIMVNDRVLARGEVVVIDEEFGIRITQIVSAEDRLRSIG